MNHKEIEKILLAKPGAWLDYPFGESVAVYKVGPKDSAKMFALVREGSDPANLSVKCRPELAQMLRDKYVTIMAGHHLDKKHWNTIICSGEVSSEDLLGFIDLSYHLVVESLPKTVQAQLGV